MGVTSSKYVSERAKETISWQRLQNHRLLSNGLLKVVDASMNTSVIIRMQAQVCARKMKLAHHHRSSSIVLGTQELASLPMLSKSKQSARVVAPVLHKLTWQ